MTEHAAIHKTNTVLPLNILELSENTIIVERNEFVKQAGSVNTDIYYIEEGSLRIFIQNEKEEQIIRFGYKNNLVVSLDSFLSEKPSDFFIQAIRRTKLKVISKKKFVDFIQQSNDHKSMWISILEDLILQQIEREKDLLHYSPAERYRRVLQRSPQLFQEIPHRHIANYLRMTPETLSRLKKH